MERSLLTPEGHKRLAAELRHHKEVLRPGVIADIADARAHGDLSENAEFEDARERQAMIEARIRDLESLLAGAEVVDVTRLGEPDRVVFGATVDLIDLETDEELSYTLVGSQEADVNGGRISYRSPIGRALLGREVGDEVEVRAPKGSRLLGVVGIRFR